MNLWTLPGREPRFLGRPARGLVNILTTLPRVSGSTTLTAYTELLHILQEAVLFRMNAHLHHSIAKTPLRNAFSV